MKVIGRMNFDEGKNQRIFLWCGGLQSAKLYYWGDLDSHGFAMLSRLRGYFPQLTSLLMDESTLDAFQSLWGVEPSNITLQTNPANLTPDEDKVFHRLTTQGVRLEQERISFGTLISVLNALSD
jgi:hypothetical protein